MAAFLPGGDAQPLGALFRAAYAGFRVRLAQADVAGEPPADAGPELAAAAARAMQAALLGLATALGRGAAYGGVDAEGDGGVAGTLQYAYAALVDELLLNSPWRGRAAWPDHLLEVQLFQTSVAGERLFERIAASTAMDNPQLLDLADIYLQCLNLGFQGQYRGSDRGPEQLQLLRKKLFFFVYRRRPDPTHGPRLLTEAADANVLLTPASQRSLGEQLRWWLYMAAAALPLLLLSSLMWWHVVSLINPVLDQIIK